MAGYDFKLRIQLFLEGNQRGIPVFGIYPINNNIDIFQLPEHTVFYARQNSFATKEAKLHLSTCGISTLLQYPSRCSNETQVGVTVPRVKLLLSLFQPPQPRHASRIPTGAAMDSATKRKYNKNSTSRIYNETQGSVTVYAHSYERVLIKIKEAFFVTRPVPRGSLHVS